MTQIEDIMKDMQINDTFHSDLCDFEIEEVITKHISNMKEANICAIISDIGRNRTSDMSVNDIRMYLEKHLEPQQEDKKIDKLRYILQGKRPTNTSLTDVNMSRIKSKLNEIILYLNNL